MHFFSNLIILETSRCNQVQCLNDGTCVEGTPGISTFAYCNCKAGFTGTRCETGSFRLDSSS